MKTTNSLTFFKIAFVSSALLLAADGFAQTNKNKTTTTNTSTSGETLVCIPMSQWNSMYGGSSNNGGTNGGTNSGSNNSGSNNSGTNNSGSGQNNTGGTGDI